MIARAIEQTVKTERSSRVFVYESLATHCLLAKRKISVLRPNFIVYRDGRERKKRFLLVVPLRSCFPLPLLRRSHA